MHSVPISTKVVSSIPHSDKVFLIQFYEINSAGLYLFLSTPIYSTDKAEICWSETFEDPKGLTVCRRSTENTKTKRKKGKKQ